MEHPYETVGVTGPAADDVVARLHEIRRQRRDEPATVHDLDVLYDRILDLLICELEPIRRVLGIEPDDAA